jgi:hypothetical protein
MESDGDVSTQVDKEAGRLNVKVTRYNRAKETIGLEFRFLTVEKKKEKFS